MSLSKDPHRLAVAALFRNEARYLEEWIEYHLMVGVEHFWLYDDSSTDDWRDVVAPYADAGLVDVVDWPIPDPRAIIASQVRAYGATTSRQSSVLESS
jgi:hypothetical protein